MKSLRKIIKAWYFPWLIVGSILRLITAAITAHPDLWALFFAQHLFVFKRVFNIYDYLANLLKTATLVANYGPNFFTYPPLAYFLFGFFGLILRPILSLENFSRIIIIQVGRPLLMVKKLKFIALTIPSGPFLFLRANIKLSLFFNPNRLKWGLEFRF